MTGTVEVQTPKDTGAPSSSLPPFNDLTQKKVFSAIRHHAALAAGLEAMTLRAMETGEAVPLEYIADLATSMKAGLEELSEYVINIMASQSDPDTAPDAPPPPPPAAR